MPSAAAAGGEQSRTEQRWAIDRKSEDGYTRLWRERARTTTFWASFKLSASSAAVIESEQERVRFEKRPPLRSVPASEHGCFE